MSGDDARLARPGNAVGWPREARGSRRLERRTERRQNRTHSPRRWPFKTSRVGKARGAVNRPGDWCLVSRCVTTAPRGEDAHWICHGDACITRPDGPYQGRMTPFAGSHQHLLHTVRLIQQNNLRRLHRLGRSDEIATGCGVSNGFAPVSPSRSTFYPTKHHGQ